VLLQIEREMQAADTGANDSDRTLQNILPIFRFFWLAESLRQRPLWRIRNEQNKIYSD